MIGCDGIRSRVRQLIPGENNPQSYPQYSCVYADSGLIPMDKAVEAVAQETAMSRMVHMGPNTHILKSPVADGKLMNVAAFVHDPDPGPHKRLDVHADVAKVLSDHANFSKPIVKITEFLLLDRDPDC